MHFTLTFAVSCSIHFLSKTVLVLSGTPNLNFFAGMQVEHCSKFDSMETFTAHTYNVQTTPRKEWKLVETCGKLTKADLQQRRRIPDVSKLMISSDIVKKANLQKI